MLYTALVGYIHYEAPEREQNFNTLIEMLNSMETREDDEDFQNPVDILFEKLKQKDPQHFAVRQYAKFKLAAGKTAKSILVSCGARLAVFDIAELREITSYDELELDTIGDRRTALFLIMSDTDVSFNFLISMVYSQMFNLLCEKADDVYGGRLPIHVRYLIDEFANIGQMLALGKMVAKLYEDRMMGTLNEDNFQMLMKNTQNEQQELEKRLTDERNQLAGTVTQTYDSRQWIDLISQYTDIKKLDSETLNRLVRQIVVHEDIDEDHVRHIRLEIHFNFQPIPAVDQYDPEGQRPYLHPDHSDRYVMAQ